MRAARMRLALRGLGEAWPIFVESRIGVLGLAIIVLFALMAIAHPILMNTVWDDRTYDAVTGFAFEETEQPAAPSWKHPLGTDPLGRDVLSQLLRSTRSEFLLGITAALVTVIILALVYFFSMYGFSMLTAHISAMGLAFLAVCQSAQVPPLLAVPLFAYLSNLCACLTNYSTGPVVIYFGLGYVSSAQWFRVGFLVALFHLVIWIPSGLLWWKILGWW